MFITQNLHRAWQPLPCQEAPHWARWAAMDRTGNWFWYEEEPEEMIMTCSMMILGSISIMVETVTI